MKNLLLSLSIWLVSISLYAQIPAGYYDAAQGKSGAALKTALFGIIKNHTERTYTNLWTDFQTTDKKANGKVWDMYSDKPGGTPAYEFTFITQQCGNYSGEGGCYNREHSFPKSWFGGEVLPMYTDLFHLVPTDGYVNNKRSNYILGEVGAASYTSSNGSLLGTADPATGLSGTVFEPIDDFKGDFARTYLYMATCYEDKIAGWASIATEAQAILAGNTYPAYKAEYVQLLLKWAKNDPVSQKEIDRNNAVYGIQNNRNPYIDHPEYVEAVWNPTNAVNEITTPAVSIYPNPVSTDFTIVTPNQESASVEVYNLTGSCVKKVINCNSGETILTNDLNNGLYLVKVMIGNSIVVKKITIQK